MEGYYLGLFSYEEVRSDDTWRGGFLGRGPRRDSLGWTWEDQEEVKIGSSRLFTLTNTGPGLRNLNIFIFGVVAGRGGEVTDTTDYSGERRLL